jgi:hypothetical protein
MATANEIIRRALRVAKVLGAGQTPSGEDIADCLTILNQMLYSWGRQGVNFNLATLVDSDTLNVPDDALMGITYSLAATLSPEYGVNVDPYVAAVADSEFRRLQRDMAYIPVVDLALPRESSVSVDYAS